MYDILPCLVYFPMSVVHTYISPKMHFCKSFSIQFNRKSETMLLINYHPITWSLYQLYCVRNVVICPIESPSERWSLQCHALENDLKVGAQMWKLQNTEWNWKISDKTNHFMANENVSLHTERSHIKYFYLDVCPLGKLGFKSVRKCTCRNCISLLRNIGWFYVERLRGNLHTRWEFKMIRERFPSRYALPVVNL